jgi:polyisoprenoid-binding protein YceI
MPPRRALLAAALALPLARPGATAAQALYRFDERDGRLDFTARHFGLLSSTGRFERFRAELTIDPARPLTSRVSVEVATAAVSLPFPGAEDLLRSAEFLDSATHPLARFEGAATGEGDERRFALAGQLTLRGVTRPQRMEARLIGRRRDATGREVADFAANGELSRSAFGMVAERFVIGDMIGLTVRVSLLV